VVITELPDPSPVPATAATPRADADTEEEAWTAVVESAHHRRKARGKAKRAGDATRMSKRIAAQGDGMHVNALTKAVKHRELTKMLKGCSIKLQAQVSKNKLIQKLIAPLGMKPMSALKAAAFGKDGLVPVGADD
jgi:hypothetical protein